MVGQITLSPEAISETASVQEKIASGVLKPSTAGTSTTTKNIYANRLDVNAYNKFGEEQSKKYGQEY